VIFDTGSCEPNHHCHLRVLSTRHGAEFTILRETKDLEQSAGAGLLRHFAWDPVSYQLGRSFPACPGCSGTANIAMTCALL
jgi:hypothetical protein